MEAGFLDRLVEALAEEAVRRQGNAELFAASRAALLAREAADGGPPAAEL